MSYLANQQRLMKVILGPHVSEKTSAAADSSRQIVFKVRPDATKKEVKQAVELLFEVEASGQAEQRQGSGYDGVLQR